MVKYINISGENGNVFNIMSKVTQMMKLEGKTPLEVSEYRDAAMSSDYENALKVSSETVDIKFVRDGEVV